MDIKQPMIVIAIDCQKSSVGVLNGLEAMPKELRRTFDMIQSCSGSEWFILMVPAGAGKGSAALHVASRLGYAPEQMMVAGDGENDLPLFEITHLGVRGVVVNNACHRLKEWKDKEAKWTVVTAQKANAGGVLEGLWRHFRHLGYSHRAAALDWKPNGHASTDNLPTPTPAPPAQVPAASSAITGAAVAISESEAAVTSIPVVPWTPFSEEDEETD